LILSFPDEPVMSEKKVAEELIHESERKYRLLAENVRDVVWTADLEGRITYISPSVKAQSGYLPEELCNQSLALILTPESAERVAVLIREQLSLPRDQQDEFAILELREKVKSGSYIDVEANASWLRDANGVPIGFVGVTRDITARKRAEQQLRESEERFRALVSLASEGIVVHENGLIVDANQAAADLAGFPDPESLIGKHAVNDVPFTAESKIAFQSHISSVSPETTNAEILRPDGTRIYVLVRGRAMMLRGRLRRIVSLLDITDRKHAQEQLAQASKMEAIGRLAGGIAHDFNNLLTTILGYSEMIQSQLADEDPIRSEIEEIHKAGERAASLTQQLLAFGRKQIIKPIVIDLNATVKEARKMLERLIGENIPLVFDLASNLGRIKADPHQIDQVLLNLAINSRDAMPRGGTLTITTANIELKDANHAHLEISPGSYVALSVADTGAGMDEKIRARLFEPFFSTKEKGKGVGLGLAMVYGIAKQNGGAVSVDSEPGAGTVFCIYLPRIDDPLTASIQPPRVPSPVGNETVLLVEDNDMVRHLARRILARLGYTVLEACNGNEAIRFSTKYPAIHLLLSDVIMPGMNGVDLYGRLQKTCPGIKAMFMSGYAEDVIMRQDVLPAGSEFIRKPFNMEDLAIRIRQVLDKN
jgi:two-component system, cell cycle sensor histidine kinase and response regulator CckA